MENTVITRRQKEKQKNKELILEAAQTLFEERGLDVVTMDDIATASEFAKGTLYNYFKNKNALVSELIVRNLSKLSSISEEIVSKQDTPFIEKLSGFVLLFLHALATDTVVFKLITPKKFFLYDDEGHIQTCFKQHMANVCSLCELGIKEGALKPMNPLLLASSLMGNIRVFAEFCTEQNCFADISLDEKKRIVMDLFMKGAGCE